MGDTSSFDSYTKQEINNLLKNYYTKSETYNKEEVNNLLNRHVTNDTFNNFRRNKSNYY